MGIVETSMAQITGTLTDHVQKIWILYQLQYEVTRELSLEEAYDMIYTF